LKRFTQRRRIKRVYPDAVGLMPRQGIGSPDGRPMRQCGRDEEGSMGLKDISGANFSRAVGRAGAFFAGAWSAERMRTSLILFIRVVE